MTEEQEIAYRFLEARRRSSSIENHKLKSDQNTTTYDVIEQYLKDAGNLTHQLQKTIYIYKEVQRGRTLSSIKTNQIPEMFPDITKEVVDEIVLKIKEQALQKFQKFFVSYKNRLQENSEDREKRIENALNDLKIAYSTYRKVKIEGWNTPSEQITISEMENLYNLINPINNDDKTEKNIEK